MLTIGEFSRLGHISARMLRHYDSIGLLHPAQIGGENSYRYYEESQLLVLAKIEHLKHYGFPLHEIASLLALSETDLARRIHARRITAYRELHEMRKTIRRMEEDVIRMEELGMSQEKYHVIVMQCPEQKVFSIRKTINISETHELFQELKAELKKRGLKRTGPTQQLYHGQEFSYEQMDVEAQAQVDADGPDIAVIPAGSFAAVTHTGPYESLKYAYDALVAWMGEHPEYHICGPAIERYIKDENDTGSPEDFETGVLFPVRKDS